MRNRFDQQLELLNEQLTRMGELCEVAIGKATTALKEGSMEQAQKVIEADEEIDQAETDIERLCLKLLLQQQPVARDLRQISAALKLDHRYGTYRRSGFGYCRDHHYRGEVGSAGHSKDHQNVRSSRKDGA